MGRHVDWMEVGESLKEERWKRTPAVVHFIEDDEVVKQVGRAVIVKVKGGIQERFERSDRHVLNSTRCERESFERPVVTCWRGGKRRERGAGEAGVG